MDRCAKLLAGGLLCLAGGVFFCDDQGVNKNVVEGKVCKLCFDLYCHDLHDRVLVLGLGALAHILEVACLATATEDDTDGSAVGVMTIAGAPGAPESALSPRCRRAVVGSLFLHRLLLQFFKVLVLRKGLSSTLFHL